uniref:Cytochrome P450 3638D2 n=1 Tax=Maconellicoccus hirsutus TaxID=177089 RepID=A0AAT9UTT2_MACHI
MENTIKNLAMNYYSFWGNLTMYMLLIAATLYIYCYKWKTRKMDLMLKSFNKMPSLPLIGSTYLLFGNMRERMIKLTNLVTDYKLPIAARMFYVPVVFIGSYEDIQIVMNKTYERASLGAFERVFGGSVTLTQGEKWRKNRRVLSTAFSTTQLQQYLRIYNEYSALLLQQLEQFSDTDRTFEVEHYIANMNLDAITFNMTGYKLNMMEKTSTEFAEALHKAVALESMRFTIPVLFPEIIYTLYLFLSGNYKVFEIIHQLPRQIVKNKLAEYKKNRHLQNGNTDDTEKQPKTLLDTLLKNHEIDAEFTEEYMEAELLSTMIVGHDSISATVSFVLLMFAMNPEAQEKAYNEIKTVFGDDERPVQTEDMTKLIYLEQCMKETFRKFISTFFTLRKHDEDIILKDKQVIPAGCTICVAFYAAHNDRRIFPNADKWDPEHFAADAIAGRDRLVSFIFGAGLRGCVGARYGMMAVKTELVHLVRRYRFTTEMKMDDIHLVMDFVPRNDSGFWLKAWSRRKR